MKSRFLAFFLAFVIGITGPAMIAMAKWGDWCDATLISAACAATFTGATAGGVVFTCNYVPAPPTLTTPPFRSGCSTTAYFSWTCTVAPCAGAYVDAATGAACPITQTPPAGTC